MKILSWNVNGIRSVHQKGFLSWLQKENAHAVCLQEVKANEKDVPLDLLEPLGYRRLWHAAEKSGYSGVAVYLKDPKASFHLGLKCHDFDREGRVLTVDFGKFVLINAYFPNSQRDHARLGFKLEFCHAVDEYLAQFEKKNIPVVVCGDFNIAHKEIDLKNPKSNKNNAGFLPEERAWMDRLLEKPYVDGFRVFSQESDQYTWWSYRPTVRERNIGWRLDYFVLSENLKSALKSVTHQNLVMGSDHCPVALELNI